MPFCTVYPPVHAKHHAYHYRFVKITEPFALAQLRIAVCETETRAVSRAWTSLSAGATLEGSKAELERTKSASLLCCFLSHLKAYLCPLL